ncbi:MAG: carotenoid biosynthesis protein [Bacteroidales bacterium]|nr:carotenoid biosynthesis protein [Bacteroidales bacterium]
MTAEIKYTIQGIRSLIIQRIKETRIILIVFYSVGIAGIAFDSTRDLFISLTPLALILSLTVLIAFHQPVNLKKEVSVFATIFISGFLIEAAGVKTGHIFGIYSYGEGLGSKLFGTPLIIGINWVFLIYCTAAIATKITLPVVFRITISSSLMVIYDLIMEQIAPFMDMWSFEGGKAPLRNYAAWFILASIFQIFLRLAGVRTINRIAPFLFLIQIFFFIILLAFYKLAE